jgi:hypothetical protein
MKKQPNLREKLAHPIKESNHTMEKAGTPDYPKTHEF